MCYSFLPHSDNFGLRIVGGEEGKSQVSIGHIVPNSPADVDGRLCIDDEIIKIDGHSTIRATHEKAIQLMQRAKENRHVCLIVRRYANLNHRNRSYHQTAVDSYPVHHNDSPLKSSIDNGIRKVTLQKANENEHFGFVIISSSNKTGSTVGMINEVFILMQLLLCLCISADVNNKCQ